MSAPSIITKRSLFVPQPELSDGTFQLLRSFIYEQTGIYFQDNKKYLLEGRIGKRLQVLGMKNFEDYCHLVKFGLQKDEERKFLYDAITIKETCFFRNPAQLEALEHKLIAEILEARRVNGRAKIRVWSAGSSSGEEAYTLAMIYLEKLKPRFPGLDIEIMGTDISLLILDTARKGIYRENSVRNMPKYYLDKYIICQDSRYCIRDEVKRLVRFEYLNLYDQTGMRLMRNFDLIFCCNVLIYFDTKSKIQVVSNLYDSMSRGGYLFIGYAETLHGISKAFKVINFPKTVTYVKE